MSWLGTPVLQEQRALGSACCVCLVFVWMISFLVPGRQQSSS